MKGIDSELGRDDYDMPLHIMKDFERLVVESVARVAKTNGHGQFATAILANLKRGSTK